MAQTIKLKRSATSGAIPTTSQLELGEVAINTYDGKMYIKKDVGGTESIVEIGTGITAADAILQEYQFTATASQTTFTGTDDNSETLSYTANAIQVFLNGVLLDVSTDYTATNGTSIVLTNAAALDDLLQIFAFKKKIGDGNVSVDTFTGDDSTVAFTLSVDPGDENNTRVFIDGVYQSKSNYSVSGTTLTFSTAPPTGTAVEVEIGNRVVTLDTLSDLDLPDDVKLQLGTDQDLEVFHNGTDSVINQTGTGDLLIQKDETTVAEFDVDGLTVTGDVEADEFIGDVRGAVLFKAQAGETLAKGEVVYISGISGNTTIVSKADADDASKMPAFGLVAAAASSGNPVDIYTNGILSDIDTSSYSEGDELFVSTTAGALTSTAPTGESAALQKIGKVTRSNATSGSIFIVGAGRSNAVPNLDDGDIFIGNSSNQAVSASLNTKIEEYLDSGVSTPTFAGLATTANMTFGDNNKAIFGAGNDLKIYHDGSDSYIDDTGTGRLRLRGAADIVLAHPTNGETYATFSANGANTFYYDNAQKLATTSTGIDVTGSVTADGLTVDGAVNISASNPVLSITDTTNTNTFELQNQDSVVRYKADANNEYNPFGGSRHEFYGDGTKNMVIAAGGDISFYEDTGTTAKFFWDSSAESLEIGSFGDTGRKATFHGSSILVDGAGASEIIIGDGNVAYMSLQTTDDATALKVRNYSGSSDLVTIERTSGNVGIGTDSPAEPLHVQEGSSGITSRAGTVALIEGSANTKLTVASGTTSTGQLLFGSSADNDAGRIIYDHSDDGLQVWTNGSRAVDVDSDGNLLVGTTGHFNYSGGTTEITVGTTATGATAGGAVTFVSNNGGTTLGYVGFQESEAQIGTMGSRPLNFTTNNTERMRIDSSGHVGIGTSSPAQALVVNRSSGNTYLDIGRATQSQGQVALQLTGGTGGTNWIMYQDTSSDDLRFFGNSSTRMTITSAGNVGIGRAPNANGVLQLNVTTGSNCNVTFSENTTEKWLIGNVTSSDAFRFYDLANSAERMRIDSNGNLNVGCTDGNSLYNNSGTNDGAGVLANGQIQQAVYQDVVHYVNRTGNDGTITSFQKDGTTVGSVGTLSSKIYVGSDDTGIFFDSLRDALVPHNASTNAARDAAINLGRDVVRFKDLYLSGAVNLGGDVLPTTDAGFTGHSDLGDPAKRFEDAYVRDGVTTGSDRRDKQDIEELSDAEQRVAVACKGLLRKWRWIDSVEEKGDDARIHFGIIAQDLQDAFTAEGLDAGRYAMFINSTWTDEETGQERSRMGVRYSELLAFIIAAI